MLSPCTNSPQQDAWIARFRRGDPEALARVREQALRIVRLQAWKLRSTEWADLVQDVVAETWQRLTRPGFSTERSLDAYVRSLAYWRCVDRLRRGAFGVAGNGVVAGLRDHWRRE